MSHVGGTHESALRLALRLDVLPDHRTDRSVVDSTPFAGKTILDLGAGAAPFPWVADGPFYILDRAVKVTVDIPGVKQCADPHVWRDAHAEADLNDDKATYEAIEHEIGCSCRGYFDVITAIEVAEHLENPSLFHRMIAHLLAPGGVAVVSSPDVTSDYAVRCFVESKKLPFFNDSDIEAHDSGGGHGHITPLFPHLWRHFIKEAGLWLAETTHNAPPPHWMERASQAEKDAHFELINVWRIEWL